MFVAKLSWCQIVRCQIVLVPNFPGAKLSGAKLSGAKLSYHPDQVEKLLFDTFCCALYIFYRNSKLVFRVFAVLSILGLAAASDPFLQVGLAKLLHKI